MKTKVVQILFYLLVIATASGAQHNGVGVGIILGEPTGISVKQWTSSTNSINVAAAWSFAENSALHLHADYVFHNVDLFHPNSGTLALYYGLGGRLKLTSKSQLAARIPIGLNYMIANNPLDLFIEIVPMLNLVPSTDFYTNAAIGIRYFF
jgi:hypothetical protein